MPTFEVRPRFTADLHQLTPEQRRRFRCVVIGSFVPDLRAGMFRPGLRIKGVRVAPGVYELTWAPDGRATWEYGTERCRGARHVVWRRIGTHTVLNAP